MLNLKKMIKFGIFCLVLSSCAAISSQEYYKRHQYFKALERASIELPKVKKIKDRERIESMIRTVISSKEYRLDSASDLQTKIEANIDMYKILSIIQANPNLATYTNVLTKYDARILLTNAINSAKEYAKNISDINELEKVLNKLREANVQNGQYSYVYQDFTRYIADQLYAKANSYEMLDNLDMAAKYYKKTYLMYENYDRNYRNAKTKYEQIHKRIEMDKANKYILEANENLSFDRKVEAIALYKKAINIYENFSETSNVIKYNAVVKRLEKEIKIKEADLLYSKAVNEYNLAQYDSAKYNFHNALRVYKEYNVVEKINIVKVYLENIENKYQKNIAEKYYRQAKQYYLNKDYKQAKIYFVKARELFQDSFIKKEIDTYIENIKDFYEKTELNNTAETYYKKAKYYFENKDYTQAKAYFIKARNLFYDTFTKNKIDEYIETIKKYEKSNIDNSQEIVPASYEEGIKLYTLYKNEKNLIKKEDYRRRVIYNLVDLYDSGKLNAYRNDKVKYILNDVNYLNTYSSYEELIENYNKAQQKLAEVSKKLFNMEKDELRKQAIKYLQEAKKYTKEKKIIEKLDEEIKEIKSKIFF